jgi:Fibronectin type III domain
MVKQDQFQLSIGASSQNTYTYDLSNSYLTLYENVVGSSGGLQIPSGPTNVTLLTIEMWVRLTYTPNRISYLFDNASHTAIWYMTASSGDVIGSFWNNSKVYINGDEYTVSSSGGTPTVLSKIASIGWAQIIVVPNSSVLDFPFYFFYSSSALNTTSIQIAELSFHDTFLTANQVKSQFSSKKSRYGLPSSPNNITVSITLSTLSMGWTVGSGSTPTGYIVYIYEVGAVNTTYTQTVSGTTSSYTSCLDSYSYYFTVVATNANGRSGQSTASSPSLQCSLGLSDPVLDPPTITGSTLTMTWTAGEGGAPTSYDVEIYESGTLKTTQTSITGTSSTYSSLVNGETYRFKVRAYNAATPSGIRSDESSGVTYSVNSAPNAPTVNAPTNSGSTLTMTWTIGTGGIPTSYSIYVLGDGSPVTTLTTSGSPPATTRTYSPMTAGVAYSFYVTATNATGTSSASATSSTVTYNPPNAPDNLIASITGDTLNMSWTAGGGGTPSYYTVYVLGDTVLVTTLNSITGTSTTYSSLTNGVYYTFYVTATNASGTSSNSSTSSSVLYSAGVVPSAPTIGSITSSSNILTLSWFPSAGGDLPTGFTVRLFSSPVPRSFVEVASSPINVADAMASSTTYSGTYGLYYRFYVVAYNAAGNSTDSAYSANYQLQSV